MKVNGQHDDLDTPPQIPLFTNVVKAASKQRDSLKDALTSAATAVVGMMRGPHATPTPSSYSTTLSPSKCARVSGQYLEHLEKLKNCMNQECSLLKNLMNKRDLLLTAFDNYNKQNETVHIYFNYFI